MIEKGGGGGGWEGGRGIYIYIHWECVNEWVSEWVSKRACGRNLTWRQRDVSPHECSRTHTTQVGQLFLQHQHILPIKHKTFKQCSSILKKGEKSITNCSLANVHLVRTNTLSKVQRNITKCCNFCPVYTTPSLFLKLCSMACTSHCRRS